MSGRVGDDLELLAGPPCLGRSVLVGVGRPAPHPWNGCERVTVCTRSLRPASGRDLRRAWCERRPVVIEVDGPLPNPSVVLEVPWWKMSPGLTLGAEVWHHLLTANAVDARDPDRPRFAPRDRALELGAAEPGPGRPGDVIAGADGPAWCDGGPLDAFDAGDLGGVPLICAANLAAGSLKPLRPARPEADLAPDQQAAVRHLGGPACIVAPAGSGKTRVLTERSRYLVRDFGVAAETVCLVAFNVRARAEMQQRTADISGLQVRTLNSLALAICNGTGRFARPAGRRRVDVLNEVAVRRLLSTMTPKKRRRAMTDQLAPWLEALSASRLGLRDLAEVGRDYAPDVNGFAEVAPLYAEELERLGAVDFDHQIIRAIEVLLTDTEARAAARRACGVLLVDEFQDLTPAHLLLIRLLAGPRAEVFGVGDDDQTIYGYTGASPEWLIDYSRYFPGAARHLLRVNYRCPAEVVEAASNLLSRNRRRVPKEITSASEHGARSGGPSEAARSSGTGVLKAPAVIETDPGGAEAVAARVAGLVASGAKPSDIAVLTRVNSTLLAPQIVLSSIGIECTKPVGPGFLERTGVASALAWLRLAVAPVARLPADALAAAARRPPRGISPRVVEWIAEQSSVRALRALAWRLADKRTSERVAALARDVRGLRTKARQGADTARLLEAIRDLGLGASLDERLDASRRSVDRSAHGDDLRALLAAARLHENPASFGSWLADQLPDGHASDWHTSGVRLATVHRVKGLEWPHVIVFAASEGLMPHRLSGDTEEERRIFHVAITRCSESLLILTAGSEESPYLSEMTDPAPRRGRRPETAAPAPESTAGRPQKPLRDLVMGLRPDQAPDSPAKPEDQPMSPDAKVRYERLRHWRLERSRADGVPAYVVFSDKVMAELARRRPVTGPALLAVPGIGPVRLAAYGEDLKRILSSEVCQADLERLES